MDSPNTAPRSEEETEEEEEEEEEATRELVLRVEESGFCGEIDEIEEHHTLADVRGRLADEFGEENLPEDFLFQRSDGVMISLRQESKKRAWKFADDGPMAIVNRPTRKKRARRGTDGHGAGGGPGAFVTPAQQTRPGVDTEESREEDEASPEAMDTDSTTGETGAVETATAKDAEKSGGRTTAADDDENARGGGRDGEEATKDSYLAANEGTVSRETKKTLSEESILASTDALFAQATVDKATVTVRDIHQSLAAEYGVEKLDKPLKVAVRSRLVHLMTEHQQQEESESEESMVGDDTDESESEEGSVMVNGQRDDDDDDDVVVSKDVPKVNASSREVPRRQKMEGEVEATEDGPSEKNQPGAADDDETPAVAGDAKGTATDAEDTAQDDDAVEIEAADGVDDKSRAHAPTRPVARAPSAKRLLLTTLRKMMTIPLDWLWAIEIRTGGSRSRWAVPQAVVLQLHPVNVAVLPKTPLKRPRPMRHANRVLVTMMMMRSPKSLTRRTIPMPSKRLPWPRASRF
jgi:hypothetical protein